MKTLLIAWTAANTLATLCFVRRYMVRTSPDDREFAAFVFFLACIAFPFFIFTGSYLIVGWAIHNFQWVHQ